MPEPGPASHPSRELRVISADTLVAGSHFLAAARPGDIACKSLAVNLSDLAAMGAEPLSVSLVVGNPPEAMAWRRDFLPAFAAQCRRYNVSLSGVTTVSGPLQISVQVVGRVPESQALRRDGARVGDGVYVSGTLGEAGLGLQIALGKCSLPDPKAHELCLARFNRPTPRIALGLALRGLVQCAIDVSDGLSGDLQHICHRSQVGMQIQVSLLPLSAAVRAHCTCEQALHFALSAGEDYELCFTAPHPAHEQIMGIAGKLNLAVIRIGRVESQPGLRFRDPEGRELPLHPAFDHFNTPPAQPAT